MPSKISVNNKEVLKDLEKKISPVLVVNNSSLKPYVELFDYAPENIYQQPLGSLVGFFEVKEYSEDSAYVVNFLTSVLKKEYYINPKRQVAESLDSALHKVNMALSELAKQGNVEWLGKLNAAICVLEKNNAHFSVAGNAKIFLYRNQGLTEISEDLASDSLEPHPLKTFVNVSSGRLEKDDRLLITSEDIFHIFSVAELKKNFQRFDGDKFVQFLKTALSNQMEMIASLVVEMTEVQVVAPVKAKAGKKIAGAANAFSGKTFEHPLEESLALDEPLNVLSSATETTETDYTDQKTGHIYVQGENIEPSENPKVALYLEATKEKFGEAWYLTKNETRRRYNLYKKQLAKKLEQRRLEKERLAEIKKEEEKRLQEERVLRELELEEQLAREKEEQAILAEKLAAEEKIQQALNAQKMAEEQALEQQKMLKEEKEKQKIAAQTKKREPAIEVAPIVAAEQAPELSFQEKLQRAIENEKRQAVIDLRALKKEVSTVEYYDEEDEDEDEEYANLPVPIHQQAEIKAQEKAARAEARKIMLEKVLDSVKQSSHQVAEFGKKLFASIANQRKSSAPAQEKEHTHLAPRFSKIKKSFALFTFNQKMYALIALAVVFIVPLFIVHFLNQPKKPTITQLTAVIPETPTAKLASEKNINLTPQKQTLLARTDLVGTVMTNVGPIAYTKTSLLVPDSSNKFKEYPITAGEGSVVRAAFMTDLSLVLIMTNQNKVISFSPVSLKFTDNNITLPNDAAKAFIGTYLTYLYVLDPAANQIYRYPRADGGFGDKTDWLKGNASLANVSDMTIDDSIYAVQNNQLIKFFKGQTQNLNLEAAQAPVHFDKIFTTLDATSLWVLDTQNGRLLAFAKDSGNIVSQYYDETLKSATSLVVDEKNKTAYAITTDGLASISL